jgi:hypothetical protein
MDVPIVAIMALIGSGVPRTSCTLCSQVEKGKPPSPDVCQQCWYMYVDMVMRLSGSSRANDRACREAAATELSVMKYESTYTMAWSVQL